MALKVLIITERFYPEEFIINDLAAEWAAGRDFEIDVLTQAPSYPFGRIFPGYSNSLFSRETWKNTRIMRFFTVTGYKTSLMLKLLNYFSFALTGSVLAVLIGGRYDRVFVYDTGPLSMAIPVFFLRKIHGKHVTIWIQDIWPDMVYAYGFKKTRLLSAFLDRLVALIYKGCDRMFISCEGFRARVTPYAPGKPVQYFPNWPVVTPAQDPLAERIKLSDKFNFTFAGNIGNFQKLEDVIRGFARARAVNGDIQLNIVGDGSDLENLKTIVREESIRGVVFWGRKKQSEMPSYFNASDVMIITLKDEPIFALTVPAKFQAYLAFSKPIFCIMKGEVRRIVEGHKTGLCVDPGDLEGIKEGFLRFYGLRSEGMLFFTENSRMLLGSVYDRNKIISAMTRLVSRGFVE